MDKEHLQAIGSRIRALREKRHISREDFAFQAGFSLSTLKAMEMGNNFKISNLYKICKLLRISADYIIFGTVEIPPELNCPDDRLLNVLKNEQNLSTVIEILNMIDRIAEDRAEWIEGHQ